MKETEPLGVPVPLVGATAAVKVTGLLSAGALDETLNVVVDARVVLGGGVLDFPDPPQPRNATGKETARRIARVANILRRLRRPKRSSADTATKGICREARSAVDAAGCPPARGEAS
jgi:hypothetical protein